MPHSAIFRELSYVFIAAVIGGIVAFRLRQPLILGYVFAGILVSPFTPGPSIHEAHTFELIAEVGVIILMFTIGLEFSIKDLLQVKWVALLGAPLGILLSGLLGALLGWLLRWGALQGLAVGLIVSVASTMVLSRLLIDRNELQSEHGRIMIGISLVEDIGTVVLILLFPALATFNAHHLLVLGKSLGKAALIVIPIAMLAHFLVPRFLAQVSRTKSEEIFLLNILAICLGAAALAEAVGLSLAIGAFAGGLILSSSQDAHRALVRLMPLRDAFVALFFVTVGTLIDPRAVLNDVFLLLAIIALVIFGKALIWASVTRLFRYPWRTCILVAVGLTQIGEFSFILAQGARSSGLVGESFYRATLAASLVTILVNAALVRWVPAWISDLSRRAPITRGS